MKNNKLQLEVLKEIIGELGKFNAEGAEDAKVGNAEKGNLGFGDEDFKD